MNGLQNLFNGQSNSNKQQTNIIMQLMSMNEEKRAETIAQILNKNGITTKEQLENLIKNTRYRR